ncbi:hypothetical protein PLICRDRAFT_382552 [Plicaturopsis crispa FD-325 SS-3]|nr:hypothetical protein PLICRDRAFT_382552 [Plicaturopsis crispa FD-325 SS-3]
MSVISDVPAGLGIDIYASQSSSLRTSRCDPIPSIARHQSADSGLPATNSHPTLRSMTAMQGLLLAESGDGMVELDPYARDGSGFREGQRFTGTAGGRSRLSRTGSSYTDSSTEGSSLSRHGTLLSFGASDGRTAAELKSLMGNGNSRLKSGATVLPPPGQPQKRSKDALDTVVLEQAKTHARVEVDIVLESYTGIQGNYFKGLIKVRVRKQSKKEEGPLLLGAGKLRIIGFECIPNEEDQHTFYQCAAPLTDITQSAQKLYASTPDNEGFCEGREGVHVLPFSIFLPITGATGKPKGALHLNSGVTVRYIAIASVKVKNPETGKHSIAHFYRNCEIWPRLNPTLILASAPRPLRAVTAKSLFMGGPGKLKLTACIHRLHWIAGQRCHVAVSVDNATKKTVRSLTLTLVRTTIVFRPQAHLDPLPASAMRSADPDACQTTTTEKHVAETRLEMGNHGAKGHASAKGWWTGVSAGDTLDFSHSIVIPVCLPFVACMD